MAAPPSVQRIQVGSRGLSAAQVAAAIATRSRTRPSVRSSRLRRGEATEASGRRAGGGGCTGSGTGAAGTPGVVVRVEARAAHRGGGADDEQFRRLAAELDRVTSGLPGPVILSDRPVRPGSLVHYRYGVFHAKSVTRVVTVVRESRKRSTATIVVRHAETLARLTAVAGPAHPVAALTPEHYAAVMAWPQMWVETARVPASSMMSAVVASSSMSWSTARVGCHARGGASSSSMK
ncbi:class III lanthionine synthetase LanKC N-terminal domain-containing protein [Nonomuraea sp. NPDC001684]